MMNIFTAADILLPKKEISPEKWAVIACDQFTSEPEYWQQVRKESTGVFSTVNLVLPEAELSADPDGQVRQIHACMQAYAEKGIYDCFQDAFVYVERTQQDGSVRKGIVGCLDLEAYDYRPESAAPVRASEKTVVERIPARMAVRDGAAAETSHVILYADDEADILVRTAAQAKAGGKCLYDFDLMLGGGHIAGWLPDEAVKERLVSALASYCAAQEEKSARLGKDPLIFAVGDGNHSLAAAKACYERAKAKDPGAALSPLRFALVELENVHDPAQVFHPIHRIVRGIDPEDFLERLCRKSAQGRQPAGAASDEGLSLIVLAAGREEKLSFTQKDAAALIAFIQNYIDAYISEMGGSVDYIHGEDSLRRMTDAQSAGILMPLIGKGDFFRDILEQGCFARKSFSIGSARDKRYYLEVRKLAGPASDVC